MKCKVGHENLHKLFAVTLVSFLGIAGSMPIYASEEINHTEDLTTPISTGDTYEYTAIDEDGNVEVIYLPEVDEDALTNNKIDEADSFDLVLKIGNSEDVIGNFDTYEEAQEAQNMRLKSRSVGAVSIEPRIDYSSISHGYVNFHTKDSGTNTKFTDAITGAPGYLNGAYAKDGAFLGYCDVNKTQVKFRQAGVTGCVSASDVSVVNVDVPETVYVSYYLVKNGTIYHQFLAGSSYSSTLNVGPMQSYMKEGATYYSYDGHYFYLDYNTMIDDYKANVYTHAINPNQPYYNYYQYLSHRTKTVYTAAQLDGYIKAKAPSNSKFQGMGKYLIDYQNTYGSNALLTLGVGINESTFGTSDIALAKNNLFGHRAYDSSPGESADTYATPQASIEGHAKDFVSRDYMDPKDAGGKYYGSNLGDQASGMNVKYASDPYWGEKAAAHAYAIDAYLGKKDINTYEIGMKTSVANLNVRSDATSSSYSLYQTGKTISYPVVILSEKSGEAVSGNNIWFRIQSDPTINADRTAMTQDVCVYDFSNAYGYVSSYYITPVKYSNVNSGDRPSETTNTITKAGYKLSGGYVSGIAPGTSVADMTAKIKGANKDATITIKSTAGSTLTSGNIGTGMTLVLVESGVTSNYNLVIYGDVNGDGQIKSNDYAMIRNHIMGTSKLTGTATIAADVNRNGEIKSNDYAFIRNHIMGVSSIQQ